MGEGFREEIMDVVVVAYCSSRKFHGSILEDIHGLPPERGDAMIVHMARHADVTTLEGVVVLMDRADSGPQLEMKRFRAIQEGLQARGNGSPRVHILPVRAKPYLKVRLWKRTRP